MTTSFFDHINMVMATHSKGSEKSECSHLPRWGNEALSLTTMEGMNVNGTIRVSGERRVSGESRVSGISCVSERSRVSGIIM